ncbi:hypothetical protein N7475_000729 [Penicillium sp. IBT 31633x]|nr:hypothetical protein N7475_000729 [Penicillium sp. IBT 31633x]
MDIFKQVPNSLSRELPQSATGLVFPVTSLISLSILSFILVHRYITSRRRRQALATVSDTKFSQQEQNSWLQGDIMEKGDIASLDSQPLSASDILRPLSHTSSFPSSGALAAMVRAEQSRILTSGANSPSGVASSPDMNESIQKCNKSIEQLQQEDVEGVRTWKRVVVEYR